VFTLDSFAEEADTLALMALATPHRAAIPPAARATALKKAAIKVPRRRLIPKSLGSPLEPSLSPYFPIASVARGDRIPKHRSISVFRRDPSSALDRTFARDAIILREIELNQGSTAAGINQRQLRCVNEARAVPLLHPRPSISPSSTPVERTRSWQRIITIRGDMKPRRNRATRAPFDIDNATASCLTLLPSPFSPPSFLYPFPRVPPRYSAPFARSLIAIDARRPTKNSSRFHAALVTRCF